jgi:hypothetical protein
MRSRRSGTTVPLRVSSAAWPPGHRRGSHGDVLAAACGIIGVVRKHRTVHVVGRTRVHLDEVEGLGRFLELEVVLDTDQPVEQGLPEARRLMAALGIQEDQLVPQAYVDLLPPGTGRAAP